MTKGLNYTFQTEHYTWPRLGLVYLKQIEVITSTSTSHLKVDFGEKARNAANAFSKIKGLAFVIINNGWVGIILPKNISRKVGEAINQFISHFKDRV